MNFRWLVIMTLYTLLIGPIVSAPNGNANAKSRLSASRPASNR